MELLVRVAVPETEREWIEAAQSMSCDRLKHLVSGCEKGDRPNDEGKGLCRARFRISVKLNAAEHELWVRARRKLEAERGRDVDDRERNVDDWAIAMAQMVLRTQEDGGWRFLVCIPWAAGRSHRIPASGSDAR